MIHSISSTLLSSSQSFKRNLFGQSPFLDWYFKIDEIKHHEFNV